MTGAARRAILCLVIIRELFAKLGLDVNAQSFAKGGLLVEAVKKGLEKLVEVADEAAHQFVEMVQGTAEAAEEIRALSQATGIGEQALQGLGRAADEEGISLQGLSQELVLLSRTMSAAKEGSSEAEAAFKKAGVSIRDGSGKLRPAEDVFIDLSEHFHTTKDGAEKTALAMQLLGRSGASMIPLLNKGKEELEEFKNAATMTPEQVAAGNEMITVQRQLAAQTRDLVRGAIGPLLPAITDLLKQYRDWKKANGDIIKLRIQQSVGLAINAVRLAGKVFTVFTKAITFLKNNLRGLLIVLGWAGLAGVLKLIPLSLDAIGASSLRAGAAAVWAGIKTAAAWALAAAPFIIVGAAIAALLLVLDDLRVYSAGGNSLFGLWADWFKTWWGSERKGGDPWWLTALKNFTQTIYLLGTGQLWEQVVRAWEMAIDDMASYFIRKLRDPIQKFTYGLFGYERSDSGKDSGQHWETTYKTRADGSKVPSGRRSVPNVQPTATAPAATPEAVPAGAARPIVAPNFVAHFSTTVAPGQDPAQATGVMRDQFESWWDGKMEEAAAAAGD
jgi:hypothetical protein